MSWHGHGRGGRRGYHHGNLREALIQAALDRSAGNISEAARVLGLTRRGLYLKLRRLGLESAEVHTR